MRSPVLWGLLAALLMTAPLAPPALAGPEAIRNAPARVMSAAEFRDAVAAAIRAKLPGARVEALDAVDELKVYRDAADKDGSSVFLTNLYGRYRNDPDNGQQIIGDFIDGVVATSVEEMPAPKPEQFVILVRPSDYLNLPVMKDAKPGEALVWKPLAGGLIQVVAVDRGKAFSMATVEQVTAAFGSLDKVWGPALANSDRTKGEVQVDQASDAIWLISSSNDLGDTLMLLPSPWKGLGIELKEAPVVVALERNLLLVTDSAAGPAEFERLKAFLAEVAGEGTVISTEMLIWKDGRWQPFAP